MKTSEKRRLFCFITAGMRGLEKSVQDDINKYLYNCCKDKDEYLVEEENFKVADCKQGDVSDQLTDNDANFSHGRRINAVCFGIERTTKRRFYEKFCLHN